jgi:GTP-binding protein
MVSYKGGRSFVMADIPGIIEGASEGRGLGLRFLRHIERNSVLLFMVPVDSTDIVHDYRVLLTELEKFNSELLTKDRLLAITKCDLVDEELRKLIEKDLKKKLKKDENIAPLFISAATGLGIEKLKDAVMKILSKT